MNRYEYYRRYLLGAPLGHGMSNHSIILLKFFVKFIMLNATSSDGTKWLSARPNVAMSVVMSSLLFDKSGCILCVALLLKLLPLHHRQGFKDCVVAWGRRVLLFRNVSSAALVVRSTPTKPC